MLDEPLAVEAFPFALSAVGYRKGRKGAPRNIPDAIPDRDTGGSPLRLQLYVFGT